MVDHDKPWRRPGTDITDYFNYGFDEFTWALYCSKQENVRKEFDQDVLAQDQKKMFEQMNMMMGMGGMPGMPGMPGVGPGGMSMDGMPPEMQQMMQQMMASGMDPSQLDPSAMFGNGAGAGGNQAQAAYGAQGNFGQGGVGFDQSMNNTADNSGNRRGNFRGRGGRRGGW